jgi:hypothetical protein
MSLIRRPGSIVLLLLGALTACGGETGPSFSATFDSAGADFLGDQAQILFYNTLNGTYKGQYIGSPDPYLAPGAAGVPHGTAFARAYLERLRERVDLRGSSARIPVLAPASIPLAPELAALTCYPTVTGVDSLGYPIDSDGDLIPDSLTVNFGHACSDQVSGLIYTYSGKYIIVDTDEGFASFRLRTLNLGTKLASGLTEENIRQVANGVETATFTTQLVTHEMEIEFDLVIDTEDQQGDLHWSAREEGTFTGDPATTMTVGGVLPSGHITYHGEYVEVADGIGEPNFRVVLRTPATVRYTSTCGNPVAGTFQGLLNGKQTTGFNIFWNGCVAPGRSYFGVSD